MNDDPINKKRTMRDVLANMGWSQQELDDWLASGKEPMGKPEQTYNTVKQDRREFGNNPDKWTRTTPEALERYRNFNLGALETVVPGALETGKIPYNKIEEINAEKRRRNNNEEVALRVLRMTEPGRSEVSNSNTPLATDITTRGGSNFSTREPDFTEPEPFPKFKGSKKY